MNTIENWLALLRVPGLQPDQYHHLLNVFGSPEKVFAANAGSLGKLGLKASIVSAVQNPATELIEADLEWLQHDNHHVITFHDAHYPELLKTIPAAPPLLFVRGDPDYLQLPQLAMVFHGPDADTGEHGLIANQGLAGSGQRIRHKGGLQARQNMAKGESGGGIDRSGCLRRCEQGLNGRERTCGRQG